MVLEHRLFPADAPSVHLRRGREVLAELHFGRDLLRVSEEGQVDTEVYEGVVLLAEGGASVARYDTAGSAVSVQISNPDLRLEVPHVSALAMVLKATRLRLCLAVALSELNRQFGHPTGSPLNSETGIVQAV